MQDKAIHTYKFAVALSECVFHRKFGTKALNSLKRLYISTLGPILYLNELIIFSQQGPSPSVSTQINQIVNQSSPSQGNKLRRASLTTIIPCVTVNWEQAGPQEEDGCS